MADQLEKWKGKIDQGPKPAWLPLDRDILGAMMKRPLSARPKTTMASGPLVPRLHRQWSVFGQFVVSSLGQEAAFGHLVLFVPVLLGVGAITWFSLAIEPPDISVWLALAIAMAGALLARHSTMPLRMASIAFLLFAIGMALAMVQTRRQDTILLDSPVTTMVVGEVISREVDYKNHWRYVVKVISTHKPKLKRPPEIVSLLTLSQHKPFAVGSSISGLARLSPPSGPALVGLNDFAFDAYFNGIGAVGYFFGPPKGVNMQGQTTSGMGWALNKWIEDIRGEIGLRIRAVLPGDTGAFATAIVTDERRAISPETTEALRLAGLAHIIAISGLNMALAAGIFYVGLRSILSLFMALAHRVAIKKIAAFGALVAASAYFLISGFAISAERAYIMMAIMLVSVFFDRPSISLRNVALSALVIMLLYPSAVMGPSFQMSFSATAALVAGYSLFQRRSGEDIPSLSPSFVRYLVPLFKFAAGIFLTSLIGGLSTAIYSIEHFHRIAAYGLPANLAAMPVISFIVMPAALVAMLLMPFGLDAIPLKIMGFGLDLVISVAKWTSSFGGDVVVGRMPIWFLPAATIGFVIFTLMRSRLRFSGLAILGVAVLASFYGGAGVRPDIVVSEDGKLVGMVDATNIATNRSRPPGFIFLQWQRALSIDAHNPPMMIRTIREGNKLRWKLTPQEQVIAETQMQATSKVLKTGTFTCQPKAWCIARHASGAIIMVSDDPAYVTAGCKIADLVITPERWKADQCPGGQRLIHKETLRKSGAMEIFISANSVARPLFNVKTAVGDENRSWSKHRRYDWKTGTYAAFSPVPSAVPIINDSDE